MNRKRSNKMAKKSIIPGLSFSWKRAVGITSSKQKLAKATGIPTTKSGRQKKVGRLFGIK
jgi:hypothetical protein